MWSSSFSGEGLLPTIRISSFILHLLNLDRKGLDTSSVSKNYNSEMSWAPVLTSWKTAHFSFSSTHWEFDLLTQPSDGFHWPKIGCFPHIEVDGQTDMMCNVLVALCSCLFNFVLASCFAVCAFVFNFRTVLRCSRSFVWWNILNRWDAFCPLTWPFSHQLLFMNL